MQLRKLFKEVNNFFIMKKGERFGTFLAFLTAFISGFSIFANKFFIIDLDPVIFTAIRAMLIGVTFLCISVFLHSWDTKRVPKHRWRNLLLIGIVGGGIAFLFFFTGLKITTAGRASFLHKTLPIYVTLLAFIFLKEKITRKQLVALCVMVLGLIVLVTSTIEPAALWSDPSVGDILVLSATVLWAVENVIAKRAMRNGEKSSIVSFARMFFGGIFLFGFALFTQRIDLLFSISRVQWLFIFLSSTLLFCYVFTYYKSIKFINVSKASTILLVSPVITLILGVLFLGEPAPLQQLIGSAIILSGAYFISQVKSEVDYI